MRALFAVARLPSERSWASSISAIGSATGPPPLSLGELPPDCGLLLGSVGIIGFFQRGFRRFTLLCRLQGS